MTTCDNGEQPVQEKTCTAPSRGTKIPPRPQKPPYPYKLAWPEVQCRLMYPNQSRCGYERMDRNDPNGICSFHAWEEADRDWVSKYGK